MELHNLKPASGAVKKRKRIARGQGSGKGGTATRGHKGARSRSGFKEKRHFEGGQMPLQMRLPKRGFNNPNRQVYRPLNLERLQQIAEKYKLEAIDPDVLVQHKIIGKKDRIKILATGELTAKISVKAHAVSASAKDAIEKAGGSIEIV